MQNIYKMKTSPEASQENIVKGERYRITMLTDVLVRLEYSEDGIFEDRATQMVINRDFPNRDLTPAPFHKHILWTTYPCALSRHLMSLERQTRCFDWLAR